MIVVDTNLVAYAVLPGERTADALALAERDPEMDRARALAPRAAQRPRHADEGSPAPGRLLQAVDHALSGDGQAAHLIAQDHAGDRLADWIHAVAHRMEGDLANAAYWYGRCGRARSEELSTEAELRLIRDELASTCPSRMA